MPPPLLLLLLTFVDHGALPHIGGARLTPGQLSFATLAMCDVGLGGSDDDGDVLQVDGFGKWRTRFLHTLATLSGRVRLC